MTIQCPHCDNTIGVADPSGVLAAEIECFKAYGIWPDDEDCGANEEPIKASEITRS